MNAERLLKLAELLETKVSRKSFNFDVFYMTDEKKECGYVACAIGHAMIDPWFTRRGFKKGKRSRTVFNKDHATPHYKGKYGWDAVENFFDLSFEEAIFLFTNYYSQERVTPKQVAKRIRKFVKNPVCVP